MLLDIQNMSRHFGGLKAVDNISFQVKEKEIVGLIGPNGAGKTTTFNTISGYYTPSHGKIFFDGRDISMLQPPYLRCRLGLARTFQVVKPFTHLTVLENVMIGGFARTDSTLESRKSAENAIELAGLTHRRDVKAGSLTAAERRRMELARALATKPRLLLLDEVMAGLTLAEVQEFLGILRKIKNEMGISLLVIEHIMAAIMTIAERIIVLHHGQLICQGTPQEVSQDKCVIDAYLGEEFQHAEGE